MDWQGALRARLLGDPTVAALVADYVPPQGPTTKAIFWLLRPQGSELPAITLQTVSEIRAQHMKGFDGLSASRVQIDCWGSRFSQVQQVKEAALAAVIDEHTGNGIHFERAFVDAIRDLGEQTSTAFIHRASLDVIFHHSTE